MNKGLLRYQALIGVGGVGAGQFFMLNDNHTLGREESRNGHFLDRRDYCKLHIITHYVKTLLGPDFTAIPVSKVGADVTGYRLRREMEAANLDIRYLGESPDRPTLFSFCFLYPDGSGGNLTTDNSAADAVEIQDVTIVEPEFARFSGRGIALAAPESPPAVRAALVRLGTQWQFLRVVALTSTETQSAWAADLLRQADLTALNLDEAAGLAQVEPTEFEPERIVAKAISVLGAINPRLLVSITAGQHGSWNWDGTALQHVPAFAVPAVGTAGAGDAHLAGLLAGLSWGLDLSHAQEVGTLVAAQSVTSPHTIHPGIHPGGLLPFARQIQAPLSETVSHVLAELS
jgi:sugar/nucleoside kinase (ribokinase family)